MDTPREIIYYKDYYLDFFRTLTPTVRKKFDHVLELISTVERIPKNMFSHIVNSTGLYEIRVEAGSNIYKIFSFFDKGRLIILINGFQKKTQKTPLKEIEKAEKLKKQYFYEKEGKK